MEKTESAKRGYDTASNYTPFVNFVPDSGPQKAFQTAYIQAIEYTPEKPARIVVIWSTDIVVIEGQLKTLGTIHRALLQNQCTQVVYNGDTVNGITIMPVEDKQPTV